jgi:hypothetical protein
MKREHQNRHVVMPSLDPTTLDRLLTMMYNINPYVEMFKMARDMMATEGAPMDLKLRLIAFRTKDACRYNVPTANEVATLMVGDGSEVVDRRDVILTQQTGPFQRISELHIGYMLYIIHCYFLTVKMDGIRIFSSMVLLLMQIWMKTMWKNLSFKESITM